MKRYLVTLIVLSAILIIFAAAAEIDYHLFDKTDDELYSLKAIIDSEIAKRGKDVGFFTPQGDYHVGKSIEPGSYYFYCAQTEDSDEAIIRIFDSEGKGVSSIYSLKPSTISYIYRR